VSDELQAESPSGVEETAQAESSPVESPDPAPDQSGVAGLGSETAESANIEAEKAGAARIEAEKAEAARIEAEKAEAARIEAEKAEAARIEAEKAEAARIEAEKAEAARIEAEKAEAARIEAEKAEVARIESEKAESARIEAARVQAAGSSPAKTDTPKLEVAKMEDPMLEEIAPEVHEAGAPAASPQTVAAAAQFPPLEAAPATVERDRKMDLLLDLTLPVAIELGRTNIQIRDILDLRRGSVVEFEKLASEPVDVIVNGKKMAEGEVVVIEKHFGIRITNLIETSERVKSLGK